MLKKHKGSSEVKVYIASTNQILKYNDIKVRISKGLVDELAELIGEENVRLKYQKAV